MAQNGIGVAGSEDLEADMTGFQLVSQTEIDQEAEYQARLKHEAEMRTAFVEGKKKYDGRIDGR
jgi:hypothetical protein